MRRAKAVTARLRDALGFVAVAALAASPIIIAATAFYFEGRFW